MSPIGFANAIEKNMMKEYFKNIVSIIIAIFKKKIVVVYRHKYDAYSVNKIDTSETI
ncbi:MAG: hypothetical protein ACLUG4_08815 [Bacilli bacterium]